MKQRKLIFLGTGTSQGVPIIGCSCQICRSTDKRDQRLRTSALLQFGGKNILIDTSPDFRQQMLINEVAQIDCVLFTHEHLDHTGGLDELRPITWHSETSLPIYAEQRVLDYLEVCYPHVMGKQKYPGAAKLDKIAIDETPFLVDEKIEVTPIRLTHFEGLPILGYRIGDFAYVTDCKKINQENIDKLKGLDLLIINALGRKEHPSHLSLPEALEIIEYTKPKQAYLTHIGHAMGVYEDVSKELPENVYMAYDGLEVKF